MLDMLDGRAKGLACKPLSLQAAKHPEK